jgi:hypothetical protein
VKRTLRRDDFLPPPGPRPPKVRAAQHRTHTAAALDAIIRAARGQQ